MVSNGIRLAREGDFAEKLVKWGFTSVYLQFDSTRPEDIIKLRGEDLWNVREKAIAALERVKLPSTLAVSLYDGLNSDQFSRLSISPGNIPILSARLPSRPQRPLVALRSTIMIWTSMKAQLRQR